jgi:hypothetical protein
LRGFALVLALLVLAMTGLASTAIMRNATGGMQVADASRLQAQAGRQAQFALHFCEAQLALAPEARAVALLPAADPPAWTALGRWRNPGADGAHALAARDMGAAVRPRVAPQCLLEAASRSGVYTVTARGFSADFRADPATGATRTGAAVWLQATIFADGAASSTSGAVTARRRTWQQLLTPPF